ncbi:MAG: hypothetical protein KGK07_07385 [Chloroflexota bacterium]|nr:hypothetical protein [Chloroflexota bacterium]
MSMTLARQAGEVRSRVVLQPKGEAIAVSPVPIAASDILRCQMRRMPPIQACRELGCSVYQLIVACHRAQPRIEYPGLPATTNDPRARAMQEALESAPEAEPQSPAVAASVAALEREVVAASAVAAAMPEPPPIPAPRGGAKPRKPTHREVQIREAVATGEQPAAFCARVGMSASQLAWWLRKHRSWGIAWPAVPNPGTAGMDALQAEIDALSRERMRDPLPGRPTARDAAAVAAVLEAERADPQRRPRRGLPAVRRAWLNVPIMVDGDGRVYVPVHVEWACEGLTVEQGRDAMQALGAVIAGRAGSRGA